MVVRPRSKTLQSACASQTSPSPAGRGWLRVDAWPGGDGSLRNRNTSAQSYTSTAQNTSPIHEAQFLQSLARRSPTTSFLSRRRRQRRLSPPSLFRDQTSHRLPLRALCESLQSSAGASSPCAAILLSSILQGIERVLSAGLGEVTRSRRRYLWVKSRDWS